MKRLKQIVKKIFNSFSLEIHSTKRNGEDRRRTLDEILSHFLKLEFKPRTVIDVGVATGTYELYRSFPNVKHLLIEPLYEFEEDLKRISSEYNAEYVIAAAGARAGNIEINVHKDLLGSSFYKEVEGSRIDGVSRKVSMVTIDELCKEKNCKGPYLIKLDVQGAERLVLDGAKETLSETDVVILEVHFFGFYVGGPQFYDIVNYMKKHEFVAYDIFGGYNRPIDYALASVDMVFVKENGNFRKNHSFARRGQRDMLNKIVIRNASQA